MLTTETEGSVIKCNNYWTETSYGPLRLKLVSRTGGKCIHHPEAEHQRTEEAGFFTSEPPTLHNSHLHSCKCESSTTIKRTFELSNTQYPQAGIRKVVHLQYLEWPDMNVPDDPRGILGLIKSVEGAVQETGGRWGCLNEDGEHSNRRPSTSQSPRVKLQLDPRTGILSHLSGCDGPVLLHCSAGVGRTGGFIVVDAVLDAVKREMKKRIYEENLGRVRSDYREPSSSPTRYPADGNSSATESKDSGDIDMASSPPPSSPLADADETPTLPPPPQPIHSHDHKRKVLEREDTLRPVVERKIEGMDSVHPSFGVDGVSKQADSSNLESAPPQFESLRRGTGRGRESVDMTSRWLKSIQSGSVRNAPPPSQSSPSQPSSIPQIFQGSSGPTTFSSSEAASEHNAGASYPLPSTSASTSSGASIFEDSSFYSDRPRMSSLNTSTSGADSPKEAFPTINSHSHPKFNLGSGVLGEIRESIEVPRHVVGDKDHRGTNQPHHPISKKLSLHPTSSDGGLVPSPLSRSSSWMEKLRQRAVSAPGPMPPTQQGDDAPAGVHQGLSQNTEERVLNAVTNIRGGEEQVFDESRPGRSEKGSIEELDKSLVPPLLYEATLPNTTNLDNTPFIPPSRTQQITLEKIAPPAAVIPPTKQEGKECSRNIPQLSFILPPNIKSRSLPIETPLDQYYTPFSTGPVTDMHCSPFGGGRFTSFDYKDPRPLHEDTTPIWLSSYEDPILEVVQDLREQRMSLCQSLRQYVFVHAAIIEGALMIVDEERQREKEKDVFSHKIPSPPATIKPAITTVQEAVVSPSNAGDKENVPLPVPTSPLSSIPPLSSPSTMTWPTPQVFMPHPPLSLNLPIGKRSASPTELIKEGKAGEMLLSKRPSIKRRPTNGTESDREGLVAPPLSPSMKTQFFSGEVHERMDSATF
ncbi:hypothetical protein AX16_000578 [Volvariella volvacea WC 439]|nr:hypothetical protein AX16_000578 [Volvariella volvacea WC 439]